MINHADENPNTEFVLQTWSGLIGVYAIPNIFDGEELFANYGYSDFSSAGTYISSSRLQL